MPTLQKRLPIRQCYQWLIALAATRSGQFHRLRRWPGLVLKSQPRFLSHGDLAFAKTKQSILFNDFCDFWRDQFLPGVVSGLNFRQHVAAANRQQFFVVLLDRLNETVFQQVPIQMPELRSHLKILGGNDLAGLEIETGIDVKPSRVLEKLAQAAEQPALAIVVKAFVEDFCQFGRAYRETQRLFGIA